MPISKCSENGKPGFQWGNHGRCYTYDPKDKSSRHKAHAKAFAQAYAAYKGGYKEKPSYRAST